MHRHRAHRALGVAELGGHRAQDDRLHVAAERPARRVPAVGHRRVPRPLAVTGDRCLEVEVHAAADPIPEPHGRSGAGLPSVGTLASSMLRRLAELHADAAPVLRGRRDRPRLGGRDRLHRRRGAGSRARASDVPDWPKCYGGTVPPADTHAVIEYANRLFTGVVGISVIAAALLAFRRRPYRWHLALFGGLLPIGVICQAILGALVVEYDLAPGLVMGHFILSMALLDAAFALAWCSRYEPDERRRSSDRLGVWAVRGADPARPADDHRRHDGDRLGPPCRGPRGPARAPLRLPRQRTLTLDRRAPLGDRGAVRVRGDRGLAAARAARAATAAPGGRSASCSGCWRCRARSAACSGR